MSYPSTRLAISSLQKNSHCSYQQILIRNMLKTVCDNKQNLLKPYIFYQHKQINYTSNKSKLKRSKPYKICVNFFNNSFVFYYFEIHYMYLKSDSVAQCARTRFSITKIEIVDSA